MENVKANDLTAEQIYVFTQLFLLNQFDNPQPTPEVHKEWWDYICSPRRYVALAAPREHAKSTAITHAYTLANLAFRKRTFIVIVSDTEYQAILFLGDLKKEILENESYAKTFGIKKLVKDAEREFIIEYMDGKQALIVARGSGSKVRGLKWRNRRPDLIVCDDLENDELVLNEERRDKFSRWFFNSLVPCLSDTGIIRVVGTIIHMDSLLNSLMPNEEDRNTVVEPLKIYNPSGLNDRGERLPWLSAKYRAHPELNDFSQLLWKEKFSEERLREIQAVYRERGQMDGYGQEYLNDPIDPEQAYFRKDDLLPIPEEELGTSKDRQYEEFYIGVDLAISEKDKRAYTVMVVAGLAADGKLRVRDVLRFRGDGHRIVEELYALNDKYRPEIIAIENENIAKALGSTLAHESSLSRVPLPLEPMPPNHDKLTRARPLQYWTRAGRVQFDKDAEWYPTLEKEMLQFPKGKYADQVDALAWIGQTVHKFVQPPTWEDIEDQEFEQELEESMFFGFDGRSEVTGY